MQYYATLPMGLEKISAEEIKELGGKIYEIRERKGRIFFSGSENLIAKINFFRQNYRKAINFISI